MKKTSMITLATLVGSSFAVQAALNFSDNFDSYSNGNIAGLGANAIGQGPWAQTGSSVVNPVQVLNGTVVLGTTGQDVYAALSTPISLTVGTTFYIGATVTLTAAQATGDYFMHFTPIVGDTSALAERLYAKSAVGGFVFGYNGTSGAANYSSSVLILNTSYRLVLAYTSVAGTANDTFALYVNPTDTAVELNNTPFFTSGYVGSGAEATNVAGINFRQGTASSAASVIIDNLSVGTIYSELAPVPEPSVGAILGGFGLLGLLMAARRRS